MEKLVGALENETPTMSNMIYPENFMSIPMQNQESLGSATTRNIQRQFYDANRSSVEQLLEDTNIGLGNLTNKQSLGAFFKQNNSIIPESFSRQASINQTPQGIYNMSHFPASIQKQSSEIEMNPPQPNV